ncbi:MAG: hypothetical protein H8E36_03490 [Rhodospirillaceae bacterium]|nr:hypothetical protein [Rhodospirillaceae bacterium]MBL6930925.1 hypothetical protein [Rhodospirillales bacterium]
MHWVNVAIILCIGNFIAWMVALYVKDAVSGLLGHVIFSTLGAFIAGYLSLLVLPNYGTAGMIPAAFTGGGLLLYLVRFRKWNWQKESP